MFPTHTHMHTHPQTHTHAQMHKHICHNNHDLIGTYFTEMSHKLYSNTEPSKIKYILKIEHGKLKE